MTLLLSSTPLHFSHGWPKQNYLYISRIDLPTTGIPPQKGKGPSGIVLWTFSSDNLKLYQMLLHFLALISIFHLLKNLK